MTWNACSCLWSAVGTINFYTGRKLVPISNELIELKIANNYEIINDILYVKINVK